MSEKPLNAQARRKLSSGQQKGQKAQNFRCGLNKQKQTFQEKDTSKIEGVFFLKGGTWKRGLAITPRQSTAQKTPEHSGLKGDCKYEKKLYP